MVAIVRRSPSRALTLIEPVFRPSRWFDELERIAEEMWESWRPIQITGLTPRTDIYEGKTGLTVKMELPGIKKEDISISLEGDQLMVKAEKKEEKVTEESTYYSCERYFGQYSRRISLPSPVNADQISATFKNGVLEIKLPKTEKTETKKIEVKVK